MTFTLKALNAIEEVKAAENIKIEFSRINYTFEFLEPLPRELSSCYDETGELTNESALLANCLVSKIDKKVLDKLGVVSTKEALESILTPAEMSMAFTMLLGNIGELTETVKKK